MNPALITALGLVVLFGGWQYWRAENLSEENTKLEMSVELQKLEIAHQLETARAQKKVIEELGVENENIRQESSNLSAKVNSLRATEHARSLAAPFERALDADYRKCLELLRFAETQGGDSNNTRGCDRFNPRRTDVAEPGEPVTLEPDPNG